MSDYIEFLKLDIQDVKIELENAIHELDNWYLPELDMKQAKRRARKLQKALDMIRQYETADRINEKVKGNASYQERKTALLNNAGVSYWLKGAIEANDTRDIADARADVGTLDDLLDKKFREILANIK